MTTMQQEFTVGPIRVDDGVDGEKWDILGQVYVPLHYTETSASFHVTFPPGSLVPRHVHYDQDEFVYIIDGEMEFELNGEPLKLTAQTQLTLPMNVPHAIYNRSDKPATALISASPSKRLYEHLRSLNGLTDKDEMNRIAALNGVPFL